MDQRMYAPTPPPTVRPRLNNWELALVIAGTLTVAWMFASPSCAARRQSQGSETSMFAENAQPERPSESVPASGNIYPGAKFFVATPKGYRYIFTVEVPFLDEETMLVRYPSGSLEVKSFTALYEQFDCVVPNPFYKRQRTQSVGISSPAIKLRQGLRVFLDTETGLKLWFTVSNPDAGYQYGEEMMSVIFADGYRHPKQDNEVKIPRRFLHNPILVTTD
jgi:hypothetical protein